MLPVPMGWQVHGARRQLGIRVSGFDAPRPVKTFAQCGFDGAVMAAVRRAGYEAPTPIQAQGLPAALCGRDVLVAPPSPPPGSSSLTTQPHTYTLSSIFLVYTGYSILKDPHKRL